MGSSVIKQQTAGLATETQPGLVGTGNIATTHIADNSISGSKLQTTSIIRPLHHGAHLSQARGVGWVRVAQLKNMSGVEFWVMATTSGNHSITKWIMTHTFLNSGAPACTLKMQCNSRHGNPWSSIRLVRNGTYDPIYFEIYIATSLTVNVSQVSAFGDSYSNSNIVLQDGSIPSGYTASQFENFLTLGEGIASI